MKRYLFLKLCLTLLCFTAAASTRSQVSGNEPTKNENRRASREIVAQGVGSTQDGDANVIKNYQGVMGKPGVDFPVLTYIPRTTFTCRGMKSGYYADLETNCQVFHICDEGRKVSFLCPNGTIFQQSDLICDWWFKVDCANSPALYDESAEQLQEDNIKRKEARKAQEAKRGEETRQRLALINNKSIENLRAQSRENPIRETHSREIPNREVFNQRKPSQRTEQNNLSKKNDNYVFNYSTENDKIKKSESKVYKETQVPAETASFISKKYNDQQNYFKNLNEVGANKITYLPQRSQADNRATKSATEKPNRGAKTYETTLTTAKPYRGRYNDYLKTTTQHTIYSPTVPPYTASKYTTRIPSTRPATTTTDFFRTKPFTTATTTTTTTTTTVAPTTTIISTVSPKAKALGGFFITKVVEPTTIEPVVYNKQKTNDQINIFANTEKETATRPATNFYKATSEFTTLIPDVTIPVKIVTNRPLVARALDNSFGTYDFTKQDYTYKTKISTPTSVYSTKPYNTVFTTITPTGFSSVDTTYNVDISTTENPTTDDNIATNRFNKYTYLPKSTPDSSSTVKPTIPTPYTSYTTEASVTDNLSNMIKTLQNLDSKDPMDIEKLLISRPGLNIPPSAGPNTLHSLAVYFATALDNLVSNDTYPEIERTTTTQAPPSTITEEDRFVTLLSRSTVDKYNLLFNENHTEEKSENYKNDDEPLDIKSLVDHDVRYNDLDGQHSQNPHSSTPRIRQLAQVFTQALSAYLDDPDTFKRVLEEIRPTEPPQIENTGFDYTFTENPKTVTPFTTDFSSYTKEEDEVLDFSDTDKSSTYSTSSTTSIPTTTKTTERSYLNEISTSFPNDESYTQSSINIYRDSRAQTVNILAVDLNNNLRYATPSKTSTTTEESTTESSYFPIKEENNEDEKKRLTAKPYGFGLKLGDITTEVPEYSITTDIWSPLKSNYNHINTNLSEFQPFDALLPPYDLSQQTEINDSHTNEEYLQSAHSQSFISHGNNLISDRKGKTLLNTETNTETTTDLFKYQTTTDSLKYPTTTQYETTSIYSSSNADIETTTNSYYTSTNGYTTSTDTSEDYSTTPESTTSYPSTQTVIPENHWSSSPIVTKLWETTLYVNPLLINRNLGARYNYNTSSTEYDSTSTTESYDFSTQETFYKTTTENTDDSKYFSTTDASELSITDIPSFAVSPDSIHNLLNTTELEIASSQANQLFGNLDLSEQDLLMEKMKMAESNSTVRRLILLLVSTCDASLNHNKTVQETRNYILHALLGVPLNKSLDSNEMKEEPVNVELSIKSRSGKALKDEDVTDVPVTEIPETSTTVDIVTSSRSYIITEKKSILAKAELPNKVVDVKNVHHNTRALELLRSLYSLAAKWSRK